MFLPLTAALAQQWEPIFNGRNLDGWVVLTEGYIGLQSESQPVEFRKVELMDLSTGR